MIKQSTILLMSATKTGPWITFLKRQNRRLFWIILIDRRLFRQLLKRFSLIKSKRGIMNAQGNYPQANAVDIGQRWDKFSVLFEFVSFVYWINQTTGTSWISKSSIDELWIDYHYGQGLDAMNSCLIYKIQMLFTYTIILFLMVGNTKYSYGGDTEVKTKNHKQQTGWKFRYCCIWTSL
jgi:hypothetical protein